VYPDCHLGRAFLARPQPHRPPWRLPARRWRHKPPKVSKGGSRSPWPRGAGTTPAGALRRAYQSAGDGAGVGDGGHCPPHAPASARRPSRRIIGPRHWPGGRAVTAGFLGFGSPRSLACQGGYLVLLSFWTTWTTGRLLRLIANARAPARRGERAEAVQSSRSSTKRTGEPIRLRFPQARDFVARGERFLIALPGANHISALQSAFGGARSLMPRKTRCVFP